MSDAEYAWEIWAGTVARWSTEKRRRAKSGKQGDGTLVALREMFLAGYAMGSLREAGKRFIAEKARAAQ